MSIEEAKAGAMALFGENTARKFVWFPWVISQRALWSTHVSNTGVISTFKIISESGIAAGVRRIEALTGDSVFSV